jgi:hypothetical protein
MYQRAPRGLRVEDIFGKTKCASVHAWALTKWPRAEYRGSPTNELLLEMLEREIMIGGIKWSASPGYPLTHLRARNDTVLQDFYSLVCRLALEILIKYRDTPYSEVQGKSSLDLWREGFIQPVRIQIKDEPHPQRKFETEEFRIIAAGSLAFQLVEKVLFGTQQRIETENWRTIPSKCGVGFTDEDNQHIWDEVENMRKQTGQGARFCDVKRWDWNTWFGLLLFEILIFIDLMGSKGTRWENMLLVYNYCAAKNVWITSDGKILAQDDEGIVRSGSFRTTPRNCRIRVLGCALADETESSAWAITNGDDSAENDVPRDYSRLFWTITEDERSPQGGSFSFNSHTYKAGGVAIPEQWARSMHNLICNVPNGLNEKEMTFSEYATQFLHENRHADSGEGPSLDNFRTFIAWFGRARLNKQERDGKRQD